MRCLVLCLVLIGVLCGDSVQSRALVSIGSSATALLKARIRARRASVEHAQWLWCRQRERASLLKSTAGPRHQEEGCPFSVQKR